MDELRKEIRRMLAEVQSQDNAPVMVDTQGLKSFLDQEGLFGIDSDLISILEGNPTPKVMYDLQSNLKFKQSNKSIDSLSLQEMLNIYLSLNNLQHYSSKIMSFASEDYH